MKKILKVLLVVVLFPVSCTLSSGILLISDLFKVEVGKEVPGIFPVLVITPGEGNQKYNVQIIYKGYLEEFINKHPEYTYLVPQGQDKHLNNQIHPGSFKVKRLPDGNQLLKVRSTWGGEGINIGWYEAADKEIFPKYFKVAVGPLAGAFEGFIGFVLTVIVWIFGFIVYKRLKKKTFAMIGRITNNKAFTVLLRLCPTNPNENPNNHQKPTSPSDKSVKVFHYFCSAYSYSVKSPYSGYIFLAENNGRDGPVARFCSWKGTADEIYP